jgi:periplasmic divalent cation tolerance protein
MKSIYRWKDVVEKSDERQVIIKTSAEHVPALEALLANVHPYDVPEFLVISIDAGSAGYLGWLSESTHA